MIPLRKFLEFDKKELHDYLESVNFFASFFKLASPICDAKPKSDPWWPAQPSVWWDENDIQVEVPSPALYRKIIKKGISKVGELHIPITCDNPRIELRVATEWGLIVVGTIEFMMTPPHLILGIWDGCGPGRHQVDRAMDIGNGVFEILGI